MEYRQLGSSGLRVPALSFGAGTFGGKGPLFSAWGTSDAAEARRLVDICLDAGVTLFDTADVYLDGASEQVLVEAIRGRRDAVLLSTKTGLPMGDGPQDWGASRARLIGAVEAALRRLGTDRIDLLQLHAFDASTPTEEVTNGQVERMNRTIKEATVKRFHYESHDQLRTHLADFMAAYNFARRLKTLSGLTPYEYIAKIWTSEPDRFIVNPIHQMPGLNS
ncbi:aldo/keto reductase [Sphingomonadaceae bacterium jetA1]|jgi:aryl-alcohol dehydrogenase-like predicted oxidoreductase